MLGEARPPAAALILGFSGLLPVGAVIMLEIILRQGGEPTPSAYLIAMPALGYAALILSFVGGMWWSAAGSRFEGALLWRWLAISVLPSLWAGASFAAGFPRGTALALAAGLILVLFADRAATKAGLVPAWWMQLRVPLSCGLALETVVAGWLA